MTERDDELDKGKKGKEGNAAAGGGIELVAEQRR